MSSFKKRRIIEFVIIFCVGSLAYSLLEILFRGFTHWTMTLTGGAVFIILYFVNLGLRTRNFVLRGLIGSLIITAAEFLVGIVVNLMFNMHVWDYSERAGNIFGQICPLFCFWWFVLSIGAVYLSVFLYWQLNKKFNLNPNFS